MPTTTDDLVQQVRVQLDESNTDVVTDAQIVQALNRGQRKAFNITVKQYEDLTWSTTTINTVAGQRAYDIPAAAYGRRIEKVELQQGNVAWEVRRISNHKKTQFITSSQVTRPFYYTIIKNKIELYPQPAGNLQLNIHYAAAPESLVLQQGRIEEILFSGSTIEVNSIGSAIGTTSTGFANYINVIDFTTGAVKGTFQVKSLDTDLNRIVIETSAGSLERTTVLNKTIGTTFTDIAAQDDYVCLITGTCVPELPEAYSDYLIQYAVVETRRRLGEPTNEEYAQLKELEKEITTMWAGREQSHRVKKANRYWGRFPGNVRRLFS